MKIVFFGDSITEGCFELSFHNAEGATDIIRDKKSVYHNVLKERIEKEHPGLDIEYVNLACLVEGAGTGLCCRHRSRTVQIYHRGL